MPRRPFQGRPKELATTSEKLEFEVFFIEKEPMQKKGLKYQFDNEMTISVKVCWFSCRACVSLS